MLNQEYDESGTNLQRNFMFIAVSRITGSWSPAAQHIR